MATTTNKASNKVRCGWAGDDATYVSYHDTEWGVPVYDDQRLFEFLVLEGAQAGLSWITILRKRDAYRKAFANFDPEKVARFNAKKLDALM
jgi:DNA-3-methyladenine glycosylase I